MDNDDKLKLVYHEKIDENSKYLRDKTLEAYITLEGVFIGVIKAIDEELPGILKEIIEKSREKCIHGRVSLKSDSEPWDELSILVCNGVIIGAAGIIDNIDVHGTEAVQEVLERISKGQYTAGIVEITELPPSFIEKRLKIDPRSLGLSRYTERKHLLKGERITQKKLGEKISSGHTIPVETSLSKTAPIPFEEARRFLPPHLIPLLGPRRGIIEQHVEEELKKEPVSLEYALSLDKYMLEFMDELYRLSQKFVGISQASVRGDTNILEVEVNVTRLGLPRKQEKMLEFANRIADKLMEIINKNMLSQKKLAVIVRHGYDSVKIVREK